MIKIGDSFQVQAPQGGVNHKWYKGKTYIVRKVVSQKIKGYDDSLDLGRMVVFVGAIDIRGKEVLHALPVAWCIPVGSSANLKRRTPPQKKEPRAT